MTDTAMTFEITRRNELFHDGYFVARFETEAAAANIAVRFAQDADAPYRIEYHAIRWEV